MIKIAVTGGIGSGKSTVLQYIKEMGYPVFSCDAIYKEITGDKNYIKQIAKIFPSAVVNGEIQRNILAEIVFNNPEYRTILNQISHGLIMKTLFERMNNCESELVFAEVPLLFEGNHELSFDKVLVIKRTLTDRIAAIQTRDHLNKEEIQKRIDSQFDYASPEAKKRFERCRNYQ